MSGFQFSKQFVRRVQEHFGSAMSPRLQEYLDEGDHGQVALFLRGSREWRTREDAIKAILTKPFIDVKVIAHRERTLKGLEDRCASEVCDFAGLRNQVLARA